MNNLLAMSSNESDMTEQNMMAEEIQSEYLDSLSLDILTLDVYRNENLQASENTLISQLQQDIQLLWPIFWEEIIQANIPQSIGLSIDKNQQQWEAELTFVDNLAIQTLNRDYRNKDQVTDVLTFCALADQDENMTHALLALPVISLGSVFVSIPYALDAVGSSDIGSSSEKLRAYLLERVFHGLLHLQGAHHDTMEDYHRVKAIQDKVIQRL